MTRRFLITVDLFMWHLVVLNSREARKVQNHKELKNMDEPTKEQLANVKTEKELKELLGQGVVKPAPLRTEGLDLSTEDRRAAMREQPMEKPYGQADRDKFGMIKRKRHPLGLGFEEEDDDKTAAKTIVDERVRQAKEARSQKELNDALAGLKEKSK